MAIILIYLAFVVFMIASQWKIFEKAGQPGWACIVPVYNMIVYLQIIKKPVWWIFLFFIPLVNLVFLIIMELELAKAFGKSTGFALGLILVPFVFIPILGFDDSK